MPPIESTHPPGVLDRVRDAAPSRVLVLAIPPVRAVFSDFAGRLVCSCGFSCSCRVEFYDHFQARHRGDDIEAAS